MSKGVLSKMDHNKTEKEDMRYLVQPRGPGKSWVFRYVTPPELVGVPNPWDGKPLGSIFCVRLDDQTAKLRLFFTAPEARGLGLGKRLLDACMGFARDRGYTRMELWTHESHEAACALYSRAGWVCTSSKPVHSFGVDLVEQAWEVKL